MKQVTSKTEFQQLINGDKPVLLDFYADWCGPCKVLSPTVERLANKYAGDFEIAKVNVDQNRELAEQFGVRSIPTLVFIQDKEEKERLVGLNSEAAIDNKIQEYLAVV